MSSLSPPASPVSYALPCTVVIKIGTSSIIHEATNDVRISLVRNVVSTVAALRGAGYRVVLVSSGAVGFGLLRMHCRSRPRRLSGKQALAAIGQGEMISMWSNIFAETKTAVAQILLTHDDVSTPKRYDNAVRTFNELFSIGVVPIVNENDTLSTKEIRIGDNDTLSAITAVMVQASYLFLLTDVDSLYASNPKYDAHASRIDLVTSVSSLRNRIDSSNLGAGSPNGTGGMETKLRAAELASAAGISTVIASSSDPAVVSEILEYYNDHRLETLASEAANSTSSKDTSSEGEDDVRPPHTLFLPETNPRRFPSFESLGSITLPSPP
ncbi:Glutamate 5-kinase [Ascochyta lentis]